MKTSIRETGLKKLSASWGNWTARGLGALVIILVLSGPALAVGIDLGLAGPSQWALLALGDGDVTVQFSTVNGLVNDVGIVGPSSGTISFTTSFSSVPGTIYEGTGVTNANVLSTRGPLVQPADTMLAAAKADALNYAEMYKNTPVTDLLLTDIDLSGFQTLTVTGAMGQNVYNLTNFRMQGFPTLTITGPVGSTFVFNISDIFDLGAGTLNLGPTISPQDVLFNVTGSTDVSIGLNDFQGLVLAPLSNVEISGANWTGEVIAGKDLTLNFANTFDPVPLPGSVLLLGTGLLGLGLLGRRRQRG
jgi:choice-of-anchor A domain-containing protein